MSLANQPIFLCNQDVRAQTMGCKSGLRLHYLFHVEFGGHGGRVVTLLPPTSEAGVRFLEQSQVGKLVVACRWSAVYSTEP